VQRALGRSVGAYIAERIGYAGDVANLPLHLKQLLQQKMAGKRV